MLDNSRFTPRLRLTALLTVVCFMLTSVVDLRSLSAMETPSAGVLTFPSKLGQVGETFVGQSGKTIILIQDLHTSIEAQKNIAEAISYFVRKEGVQTVYEEGYEGEVPSDQLFGHIKSSKVKKKVAGFYLDQLRLGGAEYAHVLRKRNFRLIGADDRQLHRQNVKSYQENARHQEKTRENLLELQQELEELTQLHFENDFREWVKNRQRYREGKLPLLDYLRRTWNLLGRQSEETEGGELLEQNFQAIPLLLSAETTRDEASLKRVKMLRLEQVEQEMSELEGEILKKYLRAELSQQLWYYQRLFEQFLLLNQLKLTPQDYQRVKPEIEKFDTKAFAEFVAKAKEEPVFLPRRWETFIQNAVTFYEAAMGRHDAIERRMDDFLKSKKETKAVLVYGGFHTPSIKQLLKEREISFLVVTPEKTTVEKRHEKHYHRLMSEGRHAYEETVLARASRAESVFNLALNQGLTRIQNQVVRVTSLVKERTHIDDQVLFPIVERELALAASETRATKLATQLDRVITLDQIFGAASWKELVGNSKVAWEIGPGDGEAIKARALSEPDTIFLFVERTYESQSPTHADRIKDEQWLSQFPKNVRFIDADVRDLVAYLPEELKTIERIYIDYPDYNERDDPEAAPSYIRDAAFVRELLLVLKVGGEFFLRTYSRYMVGDVIEEAIKSIDPDGWLEPKSAKHFSEMPNTRWGRYFEAMNQDSVLFYFERTNKAASETRSHELDDVAPKSETRLSLRTLWRPWKLSDDAQKERLRVLGNLNQRWLGFLLTMMYGLFLSQWIVSIQNYSLLSLRVILGGYFFVLGHIVANSIYGRDASPAIADQTLQTRGAYQLVQHPMYATYFSGALIFALFNPGYFSLIGLAIQGGLALWSAVLDRNVLWNRFEDRPFLREAYKGYVRETPLFTPNLKKLLKRLKQSRSETRTIKVDWGEVEPLDPEIESLSHRLEFTSDEEVIEFLPEPLRKFIDEVEVFGPSPEHSRGGWLQVVYWNRKENKKIFEAHLAISETDHDRVYIAGPVYGPDLREYIPSREERHAIMVKWYQEDFRQWLGRRDFQELVFHDVVHYLKQVGFEERNEEMVLPVSKEEADTAQSKKVEPSSSTAPFPFKRLTLSADVPRDKVFARVVSTLVNQHEFKLVGHGVDYRGFISERFPDGIIKVGLVKATNALDPFPQNTKKRRIETLEKFDENVAFREVRIPVYHGDELVDELYVVYQRRVDMMFQDYLDTLPQEEKEAVREQAFQFETEVIWKKYRYINYDPSQRDLGVIKNDDGTIRFVIVDPGSLFPVPSAVSTPDKMFHYLRNHISRIKMRSQSRGARSELYLTNGEFLLRNLFMKKSAKQIEAQKTKEIRKATYLHDGLLARYGDRYDRLYRKIRHPVIIAAHNAARDRSNELLDEKPGQTKLSEEQAWEAKRAYLAVWDRPESVAVVDEGIQFLVDVYFDVMNGTLPQPGTHKSETRASLARMVSEYYGLTNAQLVSKTDNVYYVGSDEGRYVLKSPRFRDSYHLLKWETSLLDEAKRKGNQVATRIHTSSGGDYFHYRGTNYVLYERLPGYHLNSGAGIPRQIRQVGAATAKLNDDLQGFKPEGEGFRYGVQPLGIPLINVEPGLKKLEELYGDLLVTPVGDLTEAERFFFLRYVKDVLPIIKRLRKQLNPFEIARLREYGDLIFTHVHGDNYRGNVNFFNTEYQGHYDFEFTHFDARLYDIAGGWMTKTAPNNFWRIWSEENTIAFLQGYDATTKTPITEMELALLPQALELYQLETLYYIVYMSQEGMGFGEEHVVENLRLLNSVDQMDWQTIASRVVRARADSRKPKRGFADFLVRIILPVSALAIGIAGGLFSLGLNGQSVLGMGAYHVQLFLYLFSGSIMAFSANYLIQWKKNPKEATFWRSSRFVLAGIPFALFWFFAKPEIKESLMGSGIASMVAADTLLGMGTHLLFFVSRSFWEGNSKSGLHHEVRHKFWTTFGELSLIWGVINFGLYSIAPEYAFMIPIVSSVVAFMVAYLFSYRLEMANSSRLEKIREWAGYAAPAISLAVFGFAYGFSGAKLLVGINGFFVGATLVVMLIRGFSLFRPIQINWNDYAPFEGDAHETLALTSREDVLTFMPLEFRPFIETIEVEEAPTPDNPYGDIFLIGKNAKGEMVFEASFEPSTEDPQAVVIFGGGYRRFIRTQIKDGKKRHEIVYRWFHDALKPWFLERGFRAINFNGSKSFFSEMGFETVEDSEGEGAFSQLKLTKPSLQARSETREVGQEVQKQVKEYLIQADGEDITERLLLQFDPTLIGVRRRLLREEDPNFLSALDYLGESAYYTNQKTPRYWQEQEDEPKRPETGRTNDLVRWRGYWHTGARYSSSRSVSVDFSETGARSPRASSIVDINGVGEGYAPFPVRIHNRSFTRTLSALYWYGNNQIKAIEEAWIALRLQELAFEVLGTSLDIAMPYQIIKVEQVPYEGQLLSPEDYFDKYAEQASNEEKEIIEKLLTDNYFSEWMIGSKRGEFETKGWTVRDWIARALQETPLVQTRSRITSDLRANTEFSNYLKDYESGLTRESPDDFYRRLFQAYGEVYEGSVVIPDVIEEDVAWLEHRLHPDGHDERFKMLDDNVQYTPLEEMRMRAGAIEMMYSFGAGTKFEGIISQEENRKFLPEVQVYENNREAVHRILDQAARNLGRSIGLAIGVGGSIDEGVHLRNLDSHSRPKDFTHAYKFPKRDQTTFDPSSFETEVQEMLRHADLALFGLTNILAGEHNHLRDGIAEQFKKRVFESFVLTQQAVIDNPNTKYLHPAYVREFRKWRDDKGVVFLEGALENTDLLPALKSETRATKVYKGEVKLLDTFHRVIDYVEDGVFLGSRARFDDVQLELLPAMTGVGQVTVNLKASLWDGVRHENYDFQTYWQDVLNVLIMEIASNMRSEFNGAVDEKHIVLEVSLKGNNLEIVMSDDGEGFSPQVLNEFSNWSPEKRITERKYSVGGDGMRLIYEAVSALGGDVKVETRRLMGEGDHARLVKFWFALKPGARLNAEHEKVEQRSGTKITVTIPLQRSETRNQAKGFSLTGKERFENMDRHWIGSVKAEGVPLGEGTLELVADGSGDDGEDLDIYDFVAQNFPAMLQHRLEMVYQRDNVPDIQTALQESFIFLQQAWEQFEQSELDSGARDRPFKSLSTLSVIYTPSEGKSFFVATAGDSQVLVFDDSKMIYESPVDNLRGGPAEYEALKKRAAAKGVQVKDDGIHIYSKAEVPGIQITRGFVGLGLADSDITIADPHVKEIPFEGVQGNLYRLLVTDGVLDAGTTKYEERKNIIVKLIRQGASIEEIVNFASDFDDRTGVLRVTGPKWIEEHLAKSETRKQEQLLSLESQLEKADQPAIIADFKDMIHFDDLEISDFLYLAQSETRKTPILIYNYDPYFSGAGKLDKLFKKKKFKNLKLEGTKLENALRKHNRMLGRRVIHYSSRRSEVRKKQFQDFDTSGDRFYLLTNQGGRGSLLLGLIEIASAALKDQLPDYLLQDKFGRFYFSDFASDQMMVWKNLIDRSVVFARAA